MSFLDNLLFQGAIMSQTPYLAVILKGGQIQSFIVQEWPDRVPLPDTVVVDYDIDGIDEENLTHFFNGDTQETAFCYSGIYDRYKNDKTLLSPKAVLAALDELDNSGEDEKTRIEQSLSDYLKGYLRDDPGRRKELSDFPDWPRMARLELDRRSARLLKVLPDDLLHAIARGEVDLAGLAGKIPD
jgi:hypothetical protein